MSKKILHIIDNLWLGGAQTVIKWIFEWQKNNSNIFLFSVRKQDININVSHQNIFLNNSKNKYYFPVFKLRKFIKENNIEIIHCHLAKSQIIWWFLKTLFFPNIKLVFHEHWEIFEEWKIYPKLMNFFKEKIDIFIAVSNATKKELEKKTNINKEKIVVLYNFVDLNKFKKIENIDLEKTRKKYWLIKDDFVVWFAGRLIERKWWLEFIQAAKLLKEKWYNFKYVIAWDWEDKNKIIDFIKKHNLENEIKLLWYLKDMNEFYNNINIFVFPSNWEPLWLTWLEANASSCSLIASNIPWLNEIIINNKNALLFEKQNEYDLMWKIVEMYEEEDLKIELIKWWLIESKKYSLDNYLEKLDKIYE